jgi:hypothetical protein
MSLRKFELCNLKVFGGIALASAAVVLTTFTTPALAEHPVTTAQTVIDRVQIEDLFYDYYAHIDHHDIDYDEYFVADGVLDVNGIVSKGSDPRIVVNGNTATAHLIYTIVVNDNVKAMPRFIEQGRDDSELVKKGDRWFLKSRVITSDSGLAGIFVKPYKER